MMVFIFLFRWFFGLIRPWFCYVTFLKIPSIDSEEISCILWFFWESFLQKRAIQWFPHGDQWHLFVSFSTVSNFGQWWSFPFCKFLTRFSSLWLPQLSSVLRLLRSTYSALFYEVFLSKQSKNLFQYFKLHWLFFSFF